jgi:diguanylate cyclase (GGDEF)-like protein/PAS domain S-box-containing protein
MARKTYGSTQVTPPARVLLIDDDPGVHDLVGLWLKNGSDAIDVAHAHDAETGLRLAHERHPDAILIDLDLPDQRCLELCRTLAADERLRAVPILVIADDGARSELRAFEAGASDYVSRPLSALELRARVQAALRMTRYRHQLDRIALQRETLIRLSGTAVTSWTVRLETVLKETSRTLGVQRVSYWRLHGTADEHGPAIECECLYRADVDRFESGRILDAHEYPLYFRALQAALPIIANDARKHLDTSEFTSRYFELTGIGAMMDVPVFVRGALVGVVRNEHVGGVRAWAADEQQFAVSIGQMLSLARETDERQRAEDALRISEARFRAIAQVSPVPMMVVTSLTGRTLWANTALGRLAGVDEGELRGKPVPDVFIEATARDAIATELKDKGVVDRREVRLRCAGGKDCWGMVSCQSLVFDDELAVLVGITDVTEQKRLQELLRHSALHDPLTGLPNRALIYDVIRREMGRVQRDKDYRFALLYLDLDGFKPVNDEHGHDVGDRLLVAVARRLGECLRPMDAVARVGGDEFAVVLADIHPDETPMVAARIQTALRFTDVDALVRAADEAMYARKRQRPRRPSRGPAT